MKKPPEAPDPKQVELDLQGLSELLDICTLVAKRLPGDAVRLHLMEARKALQLHYSPEQSEKVPPT